ncbi:MAG: DUF47 domain-containing protein [Parachlamydiaceae bacterium]|nr:DUF47 domain-containing protein [Parachlamydiaceae bacterium]
MLKQFLSSESLFFELFQNHSRLTLTAAQELERLVSANSNRSHNLDIIRNLEHQADELTHKGIESLHTTFITPFDHNDIYRLLSQMDDIIDLIHEVAEAIVMYQFDGMTPAVQELAQLLLSSVDSLNQIMNGFCKHAGIDTLRPLFLQVHNFEHQGDTLFRHTLGQLFQNETDARMIIKWKEIYEKLEDALDACEDVSNTIEGVLLEIS